MSFQNSHQLFQNDLPFHKIYAHLPRPIIISDNMRNPENMGAVLRLAGNIGAMKSLFISEKAQVFKASKINRTASGGSEKTSWHIIHPNDLISHIPAGYQIIALETSGQAQSIFQFTFPEKVAFLIGNEVSGIRDEIIKHASHTLYIPIPGPISSLNVTHALSIGLFFWLNQFID